MTRVPRAKTKANLPQNLETLQCVNLARRETRVKKWRQRALIIPFGLPLLGNQSPYWASKIHVDNERHSLGSKLLHNGKGAEIPPPPKKNCRNVKIS